MRVNMDSSIITDSRFKLLGKDLGRDWKEVVGACFLVWMTCYERRSKCLSKDEADASAEIDGFADALIKRGLAHEVGAQSVEIHGVAKRIQFLLDQEQKGRRGGKARGKAEKKRQAAPEANAQANASASAQAYSPALAPALSPAPAHTPALNTVSEPGQGPDTQTTALVPTGKQLAKQAAVAEAARAVVEYYQRQHPGKGRQLKPGHTDWKRIEARVREGWSADELQRAIDGNALDPWHKNHPAGHSVEFIFRNSTKVEGFIAIARDGPRLATRKGQELQAVLSQSLSDYEAPF